jgi:high-affinity iron transporter
MSDRVESPLRRSLPWIAAAALLGLCAWFTTQSLGVDPTETRHTESHGTVVVDAAIIVFREGLEAILIFAAVIASFVGTNRACRRPVVGGAGIGLLAAVTTWFLVQALLSFFSDYGPQLEAGSSTRSTGPTTSRGITPGAGPCSRAVPRPRWGS